MKNTAFTYSFCIYFLCLIILVAGNFCTIFRATMFRVTIRPMQGKIRTASPVSSIVPRKCDLFHPNRTLAQSAFFSWTFPLPILALCHHFGGKLASGNQTQVIAVKEVESLPVVLVPYQACR